MMGKLLPESPCLLSDSEPIRFSPLDSQPPPLPQHPDASMPGSGASGRVTCFTGQGRVNLRYGQLHESTGYDAVVLGTDL